MLCEEGVGLGKARLPHTPPSALQWSGWCGMGGGVFCFVFVSARVGAHLLPACLPFPPPFPPCLPAMTSPSFQHFFFSL